MASSASRKKASNSAFFTTLLVLMPVLIGLVAWGVSSFANASAARVPVGPACGTCATDNKAAARPSDTTQGAPQAKPPASQPDTPDIKGPIEAPKPTIPPLKSDRQPRAPEPPQIPRVRPPREGDANPGEGDVVPPTEPPPLDLREKLYQAQRASTRPIARLHAVLR